MTKTMILMAGIVLVAASAAHAQSAASQSDTGAFLTLSVGAQTQKRSIDSGGTFTSFNEIGRYQVAQNIGAGALVDLGGGYKFTRHLGVGISLWTARSKSAAAAGASIPDPLVFGKFTTVTTENNDLKQSTFGANVFLMYTAAVTDRVDVALSLGPTVVKTKLDVGGVTVAPNSTNMTFATESQSKTTAKAGNVGLDLSYRVNSMYSVGIFARYAGGEADLPAVPKMKVGATQAGALIRYRF
jgi:opacity protein-like surface antigen